MMKDTARSLAVRLLMRTFGGGGYSNILLDRALDSSGLSARDKRLCAMLYYGVIERLLTLECITEYYLKPSTPMLDPEVRYILYLGLYQMKYCSKIPKRASIYETVALTARFRKKSAAGFVNAILRNFDRDGMVIPVPETSWRAREVEYSVPGAMIDRVTASLGEETAAAFFENALLPPPVTVRLNPLRACADDLAELGASSAGIEYAYHVKAADVSRTAAFEKGCFHVQDLAPQICCKLVGAKPGETVLDVCAAPGGKSFTLAEMMEDTGTLYAFDLHENRVRLIEQGAQRLGLHCIRTGVQDAKIFRGDIPAADRVLCDVPCSGLGVIRRKPEIRYKPLDSLAGLPEVQYAILQNAARYVKPGGTLVYATCTVLREENEDVLSRFERLHPEFEPVPLTECGFSAHFHTFTALDHDCDGFFVGRLKRRDGDA